MSWLEMDQMQAWTVIVFLRRFFALSDDLCCFLLLQSQTP